MKTIEIWAPVFAGNALNPEASQLDLGKIEGVETIELGDVAALGTTSKSSSKRWFNIAPSQVSMDKVTGNLKEALADFQQLLNGLPKPASGYFIDEIEINLGVNSNGGIALIGKLEIGMDAAIKVKIKRESR